MGIDWIVLGVFKMSVTASVVIAAVLVCRCFLKKAPKVFSYLLWSVVLFRLLCPISIDSSLSAMGMFQPHILQENSYLEAHTSFIHKQDQPVTQSTMQSKDDPTNKTQQNVIVENTVHEEQSPMSVITCLWLIGIAVMLFISECSLIGLKRRLIGAVRLRDNIYQADHIASPFVLGLFRPRIYLVSSLSEQEQVYILLHEQTHIRRGDHVMKILGFLALTIHWFNPFVWIAYYFASKDMEMSCDEAVMKKMNYDIRADYSISLLSLATGRNMVSATPLAFGEGDTKARIKNVMSYRKPAFAVIIAAVVIVSGILLAFGSNPKNVATAKGVQNTDKVIQVKKTEKSRKGIREWKKITDDWAKAFCGRDVDKILSLSTRVCQDSLIERGLVVKEDGEAYFGYSSPWPWDDATDYQVVKYSKDYSEILYYAWTSDPHITVWRERIYYVLQGDRYVINEEELSCFDYIASGEEFNQAYPNGIVATPMDYRASAVGETLNDNAKENRQSEFYSELFEPDSAARYLLNLLKNENKVSFKTGKIKNDGSTTVTVFFMEDGEKVSIKMIQPYGEDGIWIPQF